jgi:serine/threonine protein kinase
MQDIMKDRIINKKYLIHNIIGVGSFGSIYKGENIRTNEHIAIKVEPIHLNLKLLKNESIIYQYLSDIKGIPKIKWFGKDEVNYYMVIDLLGYSLQKLIQIKKQITLKDTLSIGKMMVNLIKSIHKKGLVHRDIKPDNFLLDLKNKELYLIDFGLCKTYINDNKHIEMKKINSLIGSLNYASINSHNVIELSRRDDLESIGYIMIYFCFGFLEWNFINSNIILTERSEIVKKMKIDIINEKLPTVLLNYFNYVKKLRFDETPNYDYINDLLITES